MNSTIIDQLKLKPLFVFKFDTEEQIFGAFVRQEKNISSFPSTLNWKGSEEFPKEDKLSKVSLWILPLKKDTNEKYHLDYSSKFDFKNKEIELEFQNCIIGIFDQTGNISEWEDYKNLDQVITNLDLNFEGKLFSISKEVIPFTISDQNTPANKISGWFFGKTSISTTERLLKFDGLECDIVDGAGNKHDFHIWCGIRNKEKTFLTINSKTDGMFESETMNNHGTDCPILWSKKGLIDDTIFSTYKNADIQNNTNDGTFRLSNNQLSLNTNPKLSNKKYSTAFAYIDQHSVINYNQQYSWFIKEEGKKLYPFFKKINKDLLDDLKDYIEIQKNGYKNIYLFQINRLIEERNEKSIITWITGSLNIVAVNNLFGNMVISRHLVDKAAPASITPYIIIPKKDDTPQLITEHKIINYDVSLVCLRIFINPGNSVPKIEKGSLIADLDNRKILLSNIKNKDFKLTNQPIQPIIDNKVKFDFKDIKQENVNGTFFSVKIKQDNEEKLKEGTFDDGSFSFELDDTGYFEAQMQFSFQLRLAQRPVYLWELFPNLSKNIDSVVLCYSIEDFKIPVKKITPLSSDLSDQDRYIADNDSISVSSTGTLRPELPLIIPLQENEDDKTETDTPKYWLSFGENINVGQDFFFSTELLRRDLKETDKPTNFDVIVLGNEPQTAVKVQTPFGSNPQYDNGKWVVARKNSLSADGNVWEILNEEANDKGITLTFPPQVIGEAFRKTDEGEIFPGEPIDPKKPGDPNDKTGLVDYKFSPPATITIANEQLNRQMVTAPWNLRKLFGAYGDSNPGLRLLKAQFELLYGMSANFENKDTFIAELENKLGQIVKAPKGRIAWDTNEAQSSAFKEAYAVFLQMLKLYVSRLAIYEVSATKDKFQPAKFNFGIDYFFRIGENKLKENSEEIEEYGNGAKLLYPFKEVGNPEYLKDILNKYHNQANGLAGGFHWGFESKAVYYELMTQGLRKGSSSGEIENLAFSSLGGYGKQVARFNNDKTIIKSTTTMGRTHFYAVERIGRIGVFWNKAKHVIEYERTVVPSEQFKGTENEGRIIVRKVREFVEILEPERKYPEFGGESYAAGSVMGMHFKSIKIPVNSTWGRDLFSEKIDKDKPYGWEVPLWNNDVNHSVYPFPQIMLKVKAPNNDDLNAVLCNIENPENIYFYTDVREQVAKREITAETNDWPSVQGVDFTFQPFTNIYLEVPPCLDYNDPKLVNTPLPSPIEVLPGFERYTFKVIPSDVPISANGAYNKKSTISAKLRTVTMQRRPISFTDQKIKEIIESEVVDGKPVGKEKLNFINDCNKIINKNLNGYKGLLSVIQKESSADLIEKLRLGVQEHIKTFFLTTNSPIDKIIDQVKKSPDLRYLKSDDYVTFYKDVSTKDATPNDKCWELPTLALWNQLVSMLESTISTVDKHYKITFDTLKNELFELIDRADVETQTGKDEITNELNGFKNKILSAERFIDLHLGFIDKFFKDELKRIDNYAGIFNEELDDVAGNTFSCISDIISYVKLSDILTTPLLKTNIKTISEKKINELKKIIEKQIDSLSVHKEVKEKTKSKIDKYTNNLINSIKINVDQIPDASSVDVFKTNVIVFLESLKDNVPNDINKFKELLKQFQIEFEKIKAELTGINEIIKKDISDFKIRIDLWIDETIKKVEKELKEATNKKVAVKEVCEREFFIKKQELIDSLSKSILDLLIDKYSEASETPFPPIAHLFNRIDNWMKDVIADFNSLFHKIYTEVGNDVTKLETVIKNYLDPALSLYNEYKAIDEAIKSGDKNAIIKQANKLSQAINQDFGNAVGKVTESYYKLDAIKDSVGDLNKELQNTLFNYRSVMADIKAVDLGINRQTVELIYNFKDAQAPKLLMTPVMGKLEKLNDSLSAVGVNIPYGALEEKFIAPMKEWGSSFAKSFSNQFPMSNLLKDIGGFKFDNLLPFLKGDDTFFKAVKVESKVDEKAMKAWVKADLDYTFTDDNTLMSIGPLKVRMLRNAKIEAHAYESIDIDRQRKSDSFGTLKSTFEISLSGTPLMLFKETVVSFKNGKYDFDLDPSRMEMPGLLKLLTDASKNIPASDPSSSEEEGDSPFKMQILKYVVPNTELEIPMGVQASLNLPPLSVGGGTTAISNLSFGGHFLLKAIDDSVETAPKLDFNMGLGFYLGKRNLPFNFTAFILGGGGYIDCSFNYHPSVSNKPVVTFIMSVHGSAAFTISAGWITGSIMVFAGIEVEYYSAKGSTRIEMFVAIIGVVDLLGLISIYLGLRLAINYQSNTSGTVMYGVGNVKAKIRLCRFVTISVNKNYTMVLKGKSENVKNENSQKIATSLN